MATPTTQGRTPPQSSRIAQQAPPGTVVLQGYEDSALPEVAFNNQVALNLTQRSVTYYDVTSGSWQSVLGGADAQSFYGEVAPTGAAQAGDRWFNSKSLMWYSWNPTYGAWMAGDLVYSELAPTNPTVGQAWFQVHTRALTYFNGTSWVPGTDPTAPGVYSGAMPAAATAGSAWTDTDGVVWGCDTTYTGGTGAGKWSRWAYRVDPLAKLVLGNGAAFMGGESSASPPTPDLIWSSVTLGMIWLDTEPGSNLGKIFVWDGTGWRQVYAPNTIDLCLAILTNHGRTEFWNSDHAICTADGAKINIWLSHPPLPGSEQVYYNGTPLKWSDWSRTDILLTIPAETWFRANKVAWVDYAYDANQVVPPVVPSYVASNFIQTDHTSIAIPGTPNLGDLLVVAVIADNAASVTDSRFTTRASGTNWAIATAPDDGTTTPIALHMDSIAGSGGADSIAAVMRITGWPLLPVSSEAVSSASPAASFSPTIPSAGSFGIMAVVSGVGLVSSTINGDTTGHWTVHECHSGSGPGKVSLYLGTATGLPSAGFTQAGSNPFFDAWVAGLQ